MKNNVDVLILSHLTSPGLALSDSNRTFIGESYDGSNSSEKEEETDSCLPELSEKLRQTLPTPGN